MTGLSAAEARGIKVRAKQLVAAGRKPVAAMREAVDEMIDETKKAMNSVEDQIAEPPPEKDRRIDERFRR